MHIISAGKNKLTIEGNFSLGNSDDLSQDLKDFYSLIVKNINFTTQHAAFVGFAETSNKQFIIEELESDGIPYKDRTQDLVIDVNTAQQLKKALRLWADEAGAANYFFLVVSSKDQNIEELGQQYLDTRQRPVEVSLVIEDISDGDKNAFNVESASPVLLQD